MITNKITGEWKEDQIEILIHIVGHDDEEEEKNARVELTGWTVMGTSIHLNMSSREFVEYCA